MFTLPDLPYDYNALEPYIDEETMRIHHDKHHAAYVKNLNDAIAGKSDLENLDIETLLSDLTKVPEDIKTKVRNNGGGHYNHSFFWAIMRPSQDNNVAIGELGTEIDSKFGSFDTFVEKFTAAGVGRFGSGWVWLALGDNGIYIKDTLNQDSPIMDGETPVLGLDVWEHAYYLKYKNMRADYIKSWWNIINWDKANEIFLAKKAGDNK